MYDHNAENVVDNWHQIFSSIPNKSDDQDHMMMLEALVELVPPALTTYWTLATLAATVALLPLPFAGAFRNAVLLSACRGKLMENAPSAALGPLSDWTVPQRWFSHFYGVGSVWNLFTTSLFISSSYYFILDSHIKAVYLLSCLLVEFHLIRRLLETTAMLQYPDGARMHGIAYLFGMSYYLVVPLSVLPPDALSSMARSGIQLMASPGKLLLSDEMERIDYNALRAVEWLGIAVFIFGNFIQYHSHSILAGLSSTKPSSRGGKKTFRSSSTPQYQIPRGGFFELVSCPHYFGEIVIYLGLALLHGTSSTGPWLMVAWVIVNLVLAASMTHKWYHSQFTSRYPRNRRALIPYLY